MQIPQLVVENYPDAQKLIPIGEYLWRTNRPVVGGKQLAIVLSGPTGVGKDKIIGELDPEIFELFHTWTTRPRRHPGEGNYEFVDEASFDQQTTSGGFFETNVYNGYKYGTPKSELARIAKLGKVAILRIDFNGLEFMRQLQVNGDQTLIDWRLVNIFVTTPTLLELRERLYGRDQMEGADQRWKLVTSELDKMAQADVIAVNAQNESLEVAKEICKFVKMIR